jgi:hypothetical protein
MEKHLKMSAAQTKHGKSNKSCYKVVFDCCFFFPLNKTNTPVIENIQKVSVVKATFK